MHALLESAARSSLPWPPQWLQHQAPWLLLTTHHAPHTTHHSPLTTHHSPLTTHYSLLTTHYSLPVAYHLPGG